MKGFQVSRTLTIALLAAAFATPISAAGVDVHVGIAIPPPPSIVFQAEPPTVVVPRSRVYYVPSVTDYDMYRVGGYWYVNQGGYWYRSTAYGGPFGYVEYSHVPRRLAGLPEKYRRQPLKPHHDHDHGHKHGHHKDH